MKKLLLVPLFLLFSGCVSYYTPVNAVTDGVYYAEDDPDYNNTAYTNTPVVYNNASYYPWASLDYFYLGASSFRPSYSYGFGGYVGGGFSIGFSSGYSPWFRPYYSYYRPYGYYPPWYAYGYPRYSYGYGSYYGRYGGYGNCHYANCASPYSNRGRSHNDDRYSDNDRGKRGKRGNRNDDGNRGGNYAGNDRSGSARDYRNPNNGEDYARKPVYKGNRGRDNGPDPSNNRTTRYITTSPSSKAGNQGMVVRSRGDAKQPQKSRTHQQPTQPVTNQGRSRTSPVRQPRPVGNQGRSRITPVQPPQQPRMRVDPVQQTQPHRQSSPVQRQAPQTQPAPVVRQPNSGRSSAPPAKSVRQQPSQRAPKQSRARSNKSSPKVSNQPRSSAKNRDRDRD